ncbi:MAG: DUF4212 domain-containing protein [Phormidesmis sp.]
MKYHNSRQAYWRANKALIRNLLLVWALVSIFMSILLVEPLNSFQLGGVPFGFWMAQQGSIYVFVILIFTYAIQMDRLDRKYAKGNQIKQAKTYQTTVEDETATRLLP